MNHRICVGAVQFDIRPASAWDVLARRASAQLDAVGEADLVVFGECMTIGLVGGAAGWEDSSPREAYQMVADHTAAYEEFFSAQAVARDQAILAGTHFVREDAGLINVAHLFLPDGSVTRHQKSHLFPAEWGWLSGEGERLTCVEINGVRCGIMVCYEAEVPEIATIYRGLGVDVLLCPSFTFTRAGYHRVRHSVAARCIENQVYAVHCPVVGGGAGPIPFARGRASVLGPCDTGLPEDGVIAEGTDDAVGTVIATLDIDLLQELRESGVATTVRDRARRRDLYQRYAEYLWPQSAATSGNED
ncbi:nitrilase-related carbon-nitrogen hydrolase [Gordonia sp. NPDC003376]